MTSAYCGWSLRLPQEGGMSLCATGSMAGGADRMSAAGHAAKAGRNTPGAGGR